MPVVAHAGGRDRGGEGLYAGAEQGSELIAVIGGKIAPEFCALQQVRDAAAPAGAARAGRNRGLPLAALIGVRKQRGRNDARCCW